MAFTAGGYGQYCPISRAVEVLGERWALLIVREMLCGHSRFNDLARGNPGLSRSLLAKRLRQLESAGIVERLDGEYILSPAGEDLRSVVFGLAEWGAKWQFGDPRPNEIDPELLLWWAHQRLDYSELPDRRIVLHFVFTDIRRQFWIVKDVSGPSVCQHDPGFEIDVRVQTDIETMAHVWYEVTDLRTALRSGAIELIGAPALVRRMPKVLQLPEGGFLPTEPVGARAQS